MRGSRRSGEHRRLGLREMWALMVPCLRMVREFEERVQVKETRRRRKCGGDWRWRDWAWIEIGGHLAMRSLYFEEAWLNEDVQEVIRESWRYLAVPE